MVYEIIFRVSSPVILDAPLHLDGILSCVHPAMNGRANQLNRTSSAGEILSAPLPFDSARNNGTRVWCCSAGQFDQYAQDYIDDTIIKFTYPSDYDFLKMNHAPRTGPSRNQFKQIRGTLCSHVSFLFSSTQPNEIYRIAKRVRGLGALRKIGYGVVTSLDLQESNLDWTQCLIQQGRAMRNLPIEHIQNAKERLVCTRPPYWMPNNLEPGVLAGEECQLRDSVFLKEWN